MVYMATAIESDDLLMGELEGEIVRIESVQLGGQSGVEIGYVGLMMFEVVELHYLGADGWFEGLWGCKEVWVSQDALDREDREIERKGLSNLAEFSRLWCGILLVIDIGRLTS